MSFRRWKHGPARARHHGWLAGALLLTVAASPLACTAAAIDAPVAELEPDDASESRDAGTAVSEPTPLAVRTYEFSDEFVHPDAAVFATPWQGRRYWFAATPYPAGNSAFENPSLFWKTGPAQWTTPPGIVNPIARQELGTYLSDPDLAFDPAHDELRLYYRQTSAARDEVFEVASRDGQHWSAAQRVLSDERYSLISPAVVREDDGRWRLWAVDAGLDGCRANSVTMTERRSADGLVWDAPTPVALHIAGHVPWHADVQYIPSRHEYWALVAAYPARLNCSRTAVFFGRSTDGTTWHMFPSPLLAAGAVHAMWDLVYRSSFHYHERSDAVSVWFSGARLDDGRYRYGGASARYPLAELLRRVEQPYDVRASIRAGRASLATRADSLAQREFVQRFP